MKQEEKDKIMNEKAYKLPIIKEDDFSKFINDSEALLTAIIKDNAAKFIAGEKVMSLNYEIKMFVKRIYDEGYGEGLKAGQKISNL